MTGPLSPYPPPRSLMAVGTQQQNKNKRYFLLNGPALNPPPLLMAIKRRTFFAASLSKLGIVLNFRGVLIIKIQNISCCNKGSRTPKILHSQRICPLRGGGQKPLSAKKIYAIVEGRKMHEIYETKIIFEYMKKKHTFVLIMSVKAKGGGAKGHVC